MSKTNIDPSILAAGATSSILSINSSGVVHYSNLWYNVKDFGATGNGSTDDTTAIQAALTAANLGTVIFPPGNYVIQSTLNLITGQSLKFIGNPILTFNLSGTDSAIATSNSGDHFAQHTFIEGSAIINMQSTGGPVFNLGGICFTFGPADGMLEVQNPNGNIINIGPRFSDVSMNNVLVRNINVNGGGIPGDVIHILAQNYTSPSDASPYVLGIRFENIYANGGDSTTGYTGYAIHISANEVGPELNMNGISFHNCFFGAKSTNNNPAIYIDSSFGAGTIQFSVDDTTFTLSSGAPVAVDVDSATTASYVDGIALRSVTLFGGGSQVFSTTLIAHTVGQLVFDGQTYPYTNTINVDTLKINTSCVLTHATGLPLTTGVTGRLPVANGGTNSSTTLNGGKLVYSNATPAIVESSINISNPGTSDGTRYEYLIVPYGGGSSALYFDGYTQIGITTAKQIMQLNDFGSLCLVSGNDGSGNDFCDLLMVAYGGSASVISSFTSRGSPSVRTYSVSSNVLNLAMASGTYKTNCMLLTPGQHG